MCGGPLTLTGDSPGHIASPLYPFKYPAQVQCAWTITVDVDKVVEVRFLKMMILSGVTGGQCSEDFITVSFYGIRFL